MAQLQSVCFHQNKWAFFSFHFSFLFWLRRKSSICVDFQTYFPSFVRRLQSLSTRSNALASSASRVSRWKKNCFPSFDRGFCGDGDGLETAALLFFFKTLLRPGFRDSNFWWSKNRVFSRGVLLQRRNLSFFEIFIFCLYRFFNKTQTGKVKVEKHY